MTDHSGHVDCAVCGRPSPDKAYVCKSCVGRLRDQLRTVARIAGEAEATIARQGVRGPAVQSSGERGPVFDPVAADAVWSGHQTVMVWVRHCVALRGVAMPVVRTGWCGHTSCADIRMRRAAPGLGAFTGRWSRPGFDLVPAGPVCPVRPAQHPGAVAARWMVEQLGWLRWHPDGPQAFDELLYACRLLVGVVDQPRRWWAGPCSACGASMHPTRDATIVRCTACGERHDPASRRAWLLDQAADQTGGAAWVAATHTHLGVELSDATVRQWAKRGRLAVVDHDRHGRPLYRLGDATALTRQPTMTHRAHSGTKPVTRSLSMSAGQST